MSLQKLAKGSDNKQLKNFVKVAYRK